MILSNKEAKELELHLIKTYNETVVSQREEHCKNCTWERFVEAMKIGVEEDV